MEGTIDDGDILQSTISFFLNVKCGGIHVYMYNIEGTLYDECVMCVLQYCMCCCIEWKAR